MSILSTIVRENDQCNRDREVLDLHPDLKERLDAALRPLDQRGFDGKSESAQGVLRVLGRVEPGPLREVIMRLVFDHVLAKGVELFAEFDQQ